MTDHYASAVDVATAINRGDRDPLSVVEETLARIEDRRDATKAFVNLVPDAAREQARTVSERLAAGEDLPLAGVPVAIKDLSDTKAGVPHTRGLAPLGDATAASTSVGVSRLEAAGAVVVGTTNTPAMGHTMRTDNDLVGATATPFDTDRNAAGSSGGSAAALADGLAVLATGSDVGGSLRNPASCCNVVSVKPTHGLVPNGSRENGFAGHTPVAVRGPMARDVRSLARMLDVLAGRDAVDPFSSPAPTDYEAALDHSLALDELRLAYSPDLDRFAVDPGVRSALEDTLADLEDAGAWVDEVEIPGPDRQAINGAYMVTVTTFFRTEVAALNRAEGIDLLADHRDEVPDQLVDLAEAADEHSLDEYTATDVPRTDLYHAIEDALAGYDALVCPTLATPPLTHDEPYPEVIDGTETSGMPTDWSLAWPFNLTGHPVVNVPAGRADGLPVGMQLVGPTFSEDRLLQVAAAIESTSPWSYPDT